MKKLEKKDYIHLGVLLLFILSYVLILYFNGYIFGSTIDWANQHIVFPEYFRNLFYSGGKLIPTLALNLGMGQNIFYFSYYGLLSPIILLSYIFPFIPMYIYIPLASVISLMASIWMFYRWINNKYNSNVALISTIIFMLNTTFIYHFHRHIMFVIYMPFLIGALRSVDLYFKDKKPSALIIYSFLTIMTNYYFGAYSVIVIGIYTIYNLLKSKKFNLKKLGKVIYFEIVAILLSCILLIPTIYALLNGRVPTTVDNTVNLISLFSPITNFEYTFYNSYYSWGITFIYILGIIYGFISKKKTRVFLSLIMSLIIMFPIFSFILNGFMYFDGKCFIPFIPIALLSVSEFINDTIKNRINFKENIKYIIPVCLALLLFAIKSQTKYILIADILLMLTALAFNAKFKNKYLLFIPSIIISLISFGFSVTNETYITKDKLFNINNNAYYQLANINNKDNLYRISVEDNLIYTPNKTYNINNYRTTIYSSLANKNNFNNYRNIFQNEIYNRDNYILSQTSNVLFNIYSGTKYLITSNDSPIGYIPVKTIDGITLYQNNDILPIGYTSSKVMSKREFDKLEYPYNIDALLNYIIVDRSYNNVYKSNVQKYTSKYYVIESKNIEYKKVNDHYIINAENDTSVKIKLNEKVSNKVLLIKFNMNKAKEGYACSTGITINSITNALSCKDWKYSNNNNTFEYSISSNNSFDTLDITFTKGEFDISDIEIYTINYDNIKSIKNNITELKIDTELTTSDHIYASIITENDGFVKTTIPYERDGFKIFIDGEEVNKVKVDNAYLGFEILKGVHDIEIKYTSPYLKLGIALSILGIVLFILTIIYSHIKKQVNAIIKKINNIIKESYKKVKIFLINNKGYVLLFISLYIFDLALRIFYNRTVNYYHWYYLVPNLFSIIWISIILIFTKGLKNRFGKTIYIIFYLFSFIMFLVQSIYFSYFNVFFDYSVLAIAGEGTDYFDSVLLNIKIWVYIVSVISIVLNIKGLKLIKHDTKINIVKILLSLGIFIFLELTTPILLGKKNKDIEWDDWRNARLVYTTFNDNNKSMMVSGLFEYNIRNFYKNYFKNNTELTEEEQEVLEENFENITLADTNKYTGIFKGKNLILVQLESVDSFLVNKNIMPTLYNLTRNSINFTNHYSFTSGGGSTFNSEFMVNTGYSSAYNYNQSAYAFSRNTYTYSLPNLFKKEGYTANAFHMNTSEYYSRGVNYKAFGYDSYNGLQDLGIYKNHEYWLDTELLKNETFNKKIFNTEKPFVSYIITYSAHMPYKTTKGTCPLLTDKEGLTEEECLYIQAKETDDFVKLLIENLKEKDLADNTVVVLFSDHYIYTLENKSLLDKYKETSNNLINHTPFMIYNNDNVKLTVKDVNSQLDILPTILNLFGIEYYPNNYLGRDILDPDFDPLVFFSDGSWYNGSTYVANGENISGKQMSTAKIEKYNSIVKKKMLLNDAVIKSDYFAKK